MSDPPSAVLPQAMAIKPDRSSKSNSAGPVTLAQARALARDRRPSPNRRTGAATPPAAMATLRHRLAIERRQEERRIIEDYKNTFTTLRKRGVRGLALGPLRILAEGDSWFNYPALAFGGGIISRLEKRLGVPILNLAKAGDEIRFMLGVEERKRLISRLKRGCPAGGKWEVVLFSGGGNDVVGDPLALWIREFDPSRSPAGQIHQPRLDAALALVRAGYEDLIALRDALSPETHIVLHAYDFAIPDGRGICFFGPWLKPTFDLRGFPNRTAAFETLKVMLQQFAAMLAAFEASQARITVIRGQGTLAPKPSSWHNELHPSRAGFTTFAELFRQTLRALFPDRVL